MEDKDRKKISKEIYKNDEEKVESLDDMGRNIRIPDVGIGREGKKENIQEISETHQVSKQKSDSETKVSSVDCSSDWKSYIDSLLPPDRWFVTKEDFEIINSYHTFLQTQILDKFLINACNDLNDRCNREKVYKALVIRKLGKDLINWKRLRSEFGAKALELSVSMFNKMLDFISSSFCCLKGTDPISKANFVGLIVVVWGIWRLYIESKINESFDFSRGWLRHDEFCLSGCSQECTISCKCECCGRDINDCPNGCSPLKTYIMNKDEISKIKEIDTFFKVYMEMVKTELETMSKILRDEQFLKEYLIEWVRNNRNQQ